MPSSYVIRRLYQVKQDDLEIFLYEAIFQPHDQEPLPFSIVRDSSLSKYIASFGQRKGDYAFGLFADEHLVGLDTLNEGLWPY